MRSIPALLIGLAVTLAPVPAAAEVTAVDETGFVIHHETTVAAAPDVAWAELAKPAEWWNGEHSYSHDAANMTLDPVAGGCFCETIPGNGSVEHMRVVLIDERVHGLRLRGSLGPLQGEALTGTLTMMIEPAEAGSKITWDYVVGGYARFPLTEIAPLVDQVIGEQFGRLAAVLGKVG
jgi:hypothetical protein